MRRELEAREEGRNNVKLIWRALATMASGTAPQVIILCIFLVAPELMYRAQFSGYHFLPLSSSHVFCCLYGLGTVHSPGMKFNVVISLLLSAAHVAPELSLVLLVTSLECRESSQLYLTSLSSTYHHITLPLPHASYIASGAQYIITRGPGLLLGTEAPVLTPYGVHFSCLVLTRGVEHSAGCPLDATDTNILLKCT